MKLIDGRKVSAELRENLKKEILKLDKKPGLAVILVGSDPASQQYVGMKHRKCEEVGIKSFKYELPADVSEKTVLDLIDELNNNDEVNGILVQMPVPKHISSEKIMNAVIPKKDVDGFHPMNIGKMILGEESLQACTPRGVMKLLEAYNIDPCGKDVVVVGRSVIVGTPVAEMLKAKNATVTICHSRTKDLSYHTKNADIIVSAVGRQNIITADMVKEGVVIIDVGTNRDPETNKICGDVDFENIKEKCSYITPVPGGAGPMTIACLLENTLIAYKRLNKIE